MKWKGDGVLFLFLKEDSLRPESKNPAAAGRQPPTPCTFKPATHFPFLSLFSPPAPSNTPAAQPTLKVQPLNLLLRLRLHNPIPRGPKIAHLDPHPPFPQRHEPSFRADSLDVRTGELVFLPDELFELDVFAKGHFRGVEVEDFAFGVFCEEGVSVYFRLKGGMGKLIETHGEWKRRRREKGEGATRTIWILKEDLSVNAAGADECRV